MPFPLSAAPPTLEAPEVIAGPAAALAGRVSIGVAFSATLSAYGTLPVTLDVIDAVLDELLVSMDVLPSSAPSDLPVTMTVQDAGDAFVVSLEVIDDDVESLMTALVQRPVAVFE